jgi:hypothetical protein
MMAPGVLTVRPTALYETKRDGHGAYARSMGRCLARRRLRNGRRVVGGISAAIARPYRGGCAGMIRLNVPDLVEAGLLDTKLPASAGGIRSASISSSGAQPPIAATCAGRRAVSAWYEDNAWLV